MAEKKKGIWIEDWMADVAADHERLFALLFNLCIQNKSTQIELGYAYLAERLRRSERTVKYWIEDLIVANTISVDIKRGRGARNTFRLNMQTIAGFLDEKTCKLLQENMQINMQTIAGFNGLPHTPSNDKKSLNNKNNDKNISSFDASAKGDEDGQKKEEKIILFAEDEKAARVEPEIKKQFGKWWKLFAPIEKEQCKYHRALIEWNSMTPEYRDAAIIMLEKCGKPKEQNPYFYLQHFAPVFLNERQQYEAWKQHVQLCRVRFNGEQPICSAWMAEIFKLTVLDPEYNKKFER